MSATAMKQDNITMNSEDIKQQVLQIGQQARDAARELASVSTEQKKRALVEAAKALRASVDSILEANAKDIENAKENGISGAFLDRLVLDKARVESMAKGLEDIAKLDDPVGRELARWQRPSGLDIARVSVPLGVVGIIYESRPNVTADAGALCLKAGNAAILRGGSESFHSSQAIMDCLQQGLKAAQISENVLQLIPTTDREAVGAMLKLSDYIDVIIPRGGKGLIKRIIAESTVPTLQHLDGNCHTYIHASADPKKALDVLVNAKMRRTGICGATESLVIDEAVASDLLPVLVDALTERACEVRGDTAAMAIDSRIVPANESDWDTEYLDAIISVKVVSGLGEAIPFVNKHSSHHTDAIIAEDNQVAEEFLAKIDSAIVMRNASTQFADGGEFGMGAEIGIATGRLHARGPVGVEQLTTFKYVVRGSGETRP